MSNDEDLYFTFELGDNDNINAEFELEENDSIDCLFEINAAGTVWGSIAGTLSNQTDLQAALDLKADKSELESDMAAVDEAISDVQTVVENNYNTLDNKIDNVNSDLSGDISTLGNSVNNRIDATNQTVAELSTTVTDNNTAINNRVDGIVNSFDGDISNLETAIQNEATTRANNDILLQGGINTLRNDLTSEISNRTSADNILQDNIDNIQNTIDNYGDIISYNASDFATAAQGLLAESALQPNDNISELNNDAGYLTDADLSGYLRNTATGSNSLTIDGIASNKTNSINIGTQSTVNNNSIALGYYATATGSTSIALGITANAFAQNSIQIGSGANSTANTLQVRSYTLLDTSTGLIPDERISTNIARSSDIPDVTDYVTNSSLSTTLQDYALISSIPTKTSELINDSSFITSADLPTNYVTTDTAQDISGRKTFLGEKAIYFKQVATSNKLGFTLYNPSNTELAALEYRPNTISGASLLALNCPQTTGGYVGFRYWGTPAVNIVAPKVATAGDYYIPINFTDGTNTVTANNQGTVNISSLLPDVSNYVTNSSLATTLADYVTNSALTTTLADYALSADIPTKTSDLTNDSNFATVSQIPTNNNQLTNGAGYITNSALTPYVLSSSLATVATTGSYDDLTDKPYIPSGVVVDQTYDATSQNAQSGVAIAGAGFLTGITSGDVTTALGYTPYNSSNPSGYQANKIETIKVNGTAQTITSKAVDITVPTNNNQLTNGAGYITSSALNGYAKTADLATVATSGSYNDLSDKPTIPTVNNATLTIQKNGTTVKTFTANASSDVTCNITVPTNTNELTNGAGYITGINSSDVANALGFTPASRDLENITSMGTVISNEFYNVYTALDTKADTDLSNLSTTGQAVIDGKVSKSGDTMTGALNINVDTQNQLVLVNPYITKGTNPSERKYYGLYFNDSQNLSAVNWKDTRLGGIETSVQTNGTVTTTIQAVRNVAGNTATAAGLNLNMTSGGVASCSFPDTTCVDGQWQFINTVIMDNVSVKGSSNLTYTLSDVPDDGHMYEVMLTGNVETGTTSGNFCTLQLRSDFSTGAVTRICSARTRSSSSMQAQGTVIIPLTTSRKIYVSRNTGWEGTANLWLIGYRRIGTNN